MNVKWEKVFYIVLADTLSKHCNRSATELTRASMDVTDEIVAATKKMSKSAEQGRVY